VTEPHTAEQHRYLSTGCLHGEHAYCQRPTSPFGMKVPAQCKFCAAPCICDCHGQKFEEGRTYREGGATDTPRDLFVVVATNEMHAIGWRGGDEPWARSHADRPYWTEVPESCGPECSEQHIYTGQCVLSPEESSDE